MLTSVATVPIGTGGDRRGGPSHECAGDRERATGEDLNSLEASLAADLELLETSSDGDLRLALVRIDALEADLTAVRTRSETELVP